MLIYILFVILAIILDYFSLETKGQFFAFVYAIAGIGMLIIALALLPQPTIVNYPAFSINTPSGNYISTGYTQTITIPTSTEQLGLSIIEGGVLIQFGFILLVLSFWITERRKRKYSTG